jgi:type IV pilus assembly protein PilQ
MTSRRLAATLALLALVSNVLVFAKPGAGRVAGPEGQAFTLMSLKTESAGATTRILIESNAPPLYTVFRPADRLILVDLPGGEGSKLESQYTVGNALVDSITVRRGRIGTRNATRIEIALRGDAKDRTRLDGNLLVIELAPDRSANQPALVKAKAEATDKAPQSEGVQVNPLPVSAKTTDRAQPSTLKPATLIRAVRSEGEGNAVRIVVDADGAAQFKDFVLPDPWRVVVDITGVRSAFGNKVVPVGAASVERMRVGQPGPNVVRIVLDLKSRIPYRVERQGAQLVITVGNAATSQVNTSKQADTQLAAAAKESSKPGAAADPGAEVKVAGQRVDNPKSQIKEAAPSAAPPSDLLAQAGKPAPSNSGPSAPRVTAQPNPKLPVPTTSAPAATSTPKESAPRPAAPSTGVRSAMDVQRPGANQSQQKRGELAFCDPGFVGGPISFDLRAGVDIRDMLRFVSQQYGVNFIVDKSVGQVPVDIRVTDIPWNHVIESVMRANRLGSVCESNGRIIRIATLTAIKEEEQQQREIAEEQLKKEPLETKIIHLRYARAAGSLGDTGTGASGRGGAGGGGGGAAGGGSLLSIANSRLSARGRIEMDSRTNTLVVTDLPEFVKAVTDIIAQLDRPEPQVEIEARIVIASRNFLRDIGTELAAAAVDPKRGRIGLFETSPVQLQPGGLAPGGKDASSGGSGSGSGDSGGSSSNKSLGPNLVGPFADPTLRASVPSSVLSLTTGLIGTSIISAALSASETKGQIRTIASPRITAQDNQTAEIVNGVQIPVQTVSNNTITTTFVTAALRLEITPQIIEETGEVLMHVVAENNTVNFGLANQFNNGTPGINTQSAQSIVRLSDGGTTVMGGINIDTEGHTTTRTPGISRIPLFGELFKRRTTRRDFDEILFFITPRIVRQDGSVGPRNTAPQRSSVEGGAPSNLGPQRAAAPAAPDSKAGAKTGAQTQPKVTTQAGGKGLQ